VAVLRLHGGGDVQGDQFTDAGGGGEAEQDQGGVPLAGEGRPVGRTEHGADLRGEGGGRPACPGGLGLLFGEAVLLGVEDGPGAARVRLGAVLFLVRGGHGGQGAFDGRRSGRPVRAGAGVTVRCRTYSAIVSPDAGTTVRPCSLHQAANRARSAP
jgi:hypothetical protein